MTTGHLALINYANKFCALLDILMLKEYILQIRWTIEVHVPEESLIEIADYWYISNGPFKVKIQDADNCSYSIIINVKWTKQHQIRATS